tara:strand:+ start:428 stop:1348 length:921 start_codon:yes stop_codon:yes gene_type:complete
VKAISSILFAAALYLQAAPPEADRTAILSMAGTFNVAFSFTEDAALSSGYEIVSKPYTASALEVVVVAEDTPERIILQHILVVEDSKKKTDVVIKHWAQVWSWEDTEMLDYAGHDGIDEWKKASVPKEEVAGKWSQLVTSVDDTPRYEGSGTWKHSHGISTWTGAETRRPLPRREYTKRDDYDYILGTNTHTIGANGWLHFQDNLKVLDRGETPVALAHETGLNQYVRTESPRAVAATAWWEEHQHPWNSIRAFWVNAGEKAEKTFSYTTSHDGNGLSKTLGKLVESDTDSTKIHEALSPYLITDK